MFNKYNNYDKYPTKHIKGYKDQSFKGYENILEAVKLKCRNNKKSVVVIDCYMGVDLEEIYNAFSKLNPILTIKSDDISMSSEEIDNIAKDFLTDDRVFGIMNTKVLSDFFKEENIEKAKLEIENINSGIVLVYGVGASIIYDGDITLFADLARWEIQTRYRMGMGNWKANNGSEDILRKYKRGFFLEWRAMDRHKKCVFEKMDYLLDTNKKDDPKMITKYAFKGALEKISKEPFRVVPYFDPGVWGGQWMKSVCGLDKEKENFASSFDEKLLSVLDFVISTMKLDKINKDRIVYVKNLLDEEEIQNIKSKINDVQSSEISLDKRFKEDLFFMDSNITNKSEAIKFMTDKLVDRGYINSEIQREFFKREELSSTEIGDLVAIPHTMHSDIKESFICVLILKKSILWDKKQVQIVILIGMANHEQKSGS